MNKKIISGFLMFALAVFSMSSFVACKDYDEDSYDDLKARLNKEISLREALQNQVNALDAAIKQIKSCNCDPSKYASKDEFNKAMQRIDSIADVLKNLKPGETYNDQWIKDRFKDVSDSLKLLNQLNSWIIYVQNLAKQDSIRIDSLSGVVSGWGSTITELYTRVDSLIQALKHQKKDTIYVYHKDTIYISGGGCDSLCAAKIAKAQFTADSALTVAERALVLAVNNANRISALEKYVNGLVTSGELAEEVRKLNERIESLLDKMVTGIIIQGTESPVIGYFNTPLDVRTQMLAAYYGEVKESVHFPSVSTADYVDPSMFWTERNVEVMGINPRYAEGNVDINGRFVGQKNGSEIGNAGTLYLTVNPSNVDFEGKQLTLETSQGNAAAITLSPLAKTDKELSFGYTRAANNGFYETQATLTAENIDAAKIKVDYTTLEDEAKQLLKQKNLTSVLGLGFALINSMEDVMPAYGVKATWTSPYNTYNYSTKNYDVYSQYGIAATAIKPLSYAFLKDFKANLPGEDRIIKLLDQIIDKINIKINLNLPDFLKYKGSITFKDITLPTIDDDMFRITYHKVYTSDDLAGEGKLYGDASETNLYFLVTNVKDGRYALVSTAADGSTQELWIYDPTTDTYHKATAAEQAAWGAIEFGLTVDVDINKTPEIKQTLQDIVDKLNAEYGANSDLAKTITNLLNDVASLGDLDAKISQAISDAKDDIKKTLNSYVTRIYNKLNNILSTAPNRALQPTIIAIKSDKKAGLLSRSKANPTKASGTLTLIPTSYTLEMLAPAYKKFVAVTNVFNADGTEADASIGQAANSGMNLLKVIDSEKYCTISGQSGYTYEITYTAVDYHGKVAAKKFYVKF